MKSEQQLLETKERIDKRIKETQERMNNCVSEFQYGIYRDENIKLIAQYNLLIDILNG